MAYILEDEMLEVTPTAIRMRKKVSSWKGVDAATFWKTSKISRAQRKGFAAYTSWHASCPVEVGIHSCELMGSRACHGRGGEALFAGEDDGMRTWQELDTSKRARAARDKNKSR